MIQKDQEENSALVVDAYGVKIRTKAGDLGEEPAQSWSDVRHQVRGHLLRLATGPTRLLVEIIEGATKLVRGISGLPRTLSERIANSHNAADQRELSRSESVIANEDAALRRVDQILQRLRVQGLCAEILIREDGRPVIIVVTPSERDAAALLAEDSGDTPKRSEMNVWDED